MRGVLLMCLLVLTAALSLHYSRVLEESRLPENNRSDPLIAMYRPTDPDQWEDPELSPADTASADDFAD